MTPARPYGKARSVNSDSANFPTWVTSEFAEIGTYYADPGTAAGRVKTRLSHLHGNGLVPCWLHLMPYGLGADNDAFSLRAVGIRRIATPIADGRVQFIRELIAVLGCTISTAVGLAGGIVLDTERFADAITITYEGTYTADVTRTGSIKLYSPPVGSANTPASALIPLVGYEGYELEWDQTTGTPTMNSLVSYLSGGDE